MSRNNSQQKSTSDAHIHHKQMGVNREEWAVSLLRVRIRTESPEGNLRELTRDSNLNCGIARERELTWEKP